MKTHTTMYMIDNQPRPTALWILYVTSLISLRCDHIILWQTNIRKESKKNEYVSIYNWTYCCTLKLTWHWNQILSNNISQKSRGVVEWEDWELKREYGKIGVRYCRGDPAHRNTKYKETLRIKWKDLQTLKESQEEKTDDARRSQHVRFFQQWLWDSNSPGN